MDVRLMKMGELWTVDYDGLVKEGYKTKLYTSKTLGKQTTVKKTR